MAELFNVAEIESGRAASGKLYREFLRVPAMSAGLYVLPAGSRDPQQPHAEDEIYYVLRGRARMKSGEREFEVAAGGVIFVPAREPHHFFDIREELALLVVFAPAEGKEPTR